MKAAKYSIVMRGTNHNIVVGKGYNKNQAERIASRIREGHFLSKVEVMRSAKAEVLLSPKLL